MGKIKYLFSRIKKMDFTRMFSYVDKVAKKTGRSKIIIFFDTVWCGLVYQAGYVDYDLFEMYNLNRKQRKTIVTRGINNGFIKTYNNPNYNELFRNKKKFNKLFQSYLGRKWLDIDHCNLEEMREFLSGLDEVILKPSEGTHGKGIEKLNIDKKDVERFYVEWKEQYPDYLAEEVVEQNSIMNQLHPDSVNTCRVISLLKEGTVHIVATYMRIGNGKIVDNFNNGGMVVPVNKETGMVEYPALDKAGSLFKVHPLTGTEIIGFQLPMFQEALSLVREAGTIVPQVGLVGWDVAFSTKGPLFIEANEFPGHDIYQLPPHRTDGIGMLPEFEKILNGKS
jgi:hypothetical protein